MHTHAWLLNLDELLVESTARSAASDVRVASAFDECEAFERSLHRLLLKPNDRLDALCKRCIEGCKEGPRQIPLGLLLAERGSNRDALVAVLKQWVGNAAASGGRPMAARLARILLRVPRFKVPILTRDRCTAAEAASIFERANRFGEDIEKVQLASALLFVRRPKCRRAIADLVSEVATAGKANENRGLVGLDESDVLLAALVAGREEGSRDLTLRQDRLLDDIRSGESLDVLSHGLDSLRGARQPVARLLAECGVDGRKAWPVPMASVALFACLARVNDPDEFLRVGANRLLVKRWWWRRSLAHDAASSTTLLVKLVLELESLLRGETRDGHSEDSWSLAAFGIDPRRVRFGSAAKALSALLTQLGLPDFRCWTPRDTRDQRDLHHIFPKRWLKERGRLDGDCFANLTLIDRDTNQKCIRDKDPSVYVRQLEKEAASPRAVEQFAAVLHEHGIAINDLRSENIDAMMQTRCEWFDAKIRELDHSLRA